ncbi:MAG: NAD(P)-binding domain-containing protein [Sandaracinaceae bacterium]|nr:NAD(P)-binding domain-containing protein [Sandaracinaceae bacterium]
MSSTVGVVGAGAFGRALAEAIARRGHEVLLWSRRRIEVKGVTCAAEVSRLAAADLIFVSVPSMHVPALAPELGQHLDGRHLLVHVSRGLIGDDLTTVAQHLSANTPCRRVGCLAGPLNSEGLAEDVPGVGVVGTGFGEVADAVREALAGPDLRLYETDDRIGVEVASALVGLLALAAGFGLEKRVTPAALATMLNRGVAEAARVGQKLGGREETFHGMAGAGDLLAAVAGDERAEVRLGRAMARGLDLQRAGAEAGAYIEGVTIARRVAAYAEGVGIDAPIASVLADMIAGKLSEEGAITTLMSR